MCDGHAPLAGIDDDVVNRYGFTHGDIVLLRQR
jgi:hypothetical protein